MDLFPVLNIVCQGSAKDPFNFDPDPGHEHFIKIYRNFFVIFLQKLD